jgi:hypothetical protein
MKKISLASAWLETLVVSSLDYCVHQHLFACTGYACAYVLFLFNEHQMFVWLHQRLIRLCMYEA